MINFCKSFYNFISMESKKDDVYNTLEKESCLHLWKIPTVSLSIIIPAYNEEERLPRMLNECFSYLEMPENDAKLSYEIIIVDDGSCDRTSEVGHYYQKMYGKEKVQIINLKKNHGKGAAVRTGVLVARGDHILFADADGATKFSDISKLEHILSSKMEKDVIVIGSRARAEKEVTIQRTLGRQLLMHIFHFFIWLSCVRTVQDSQCGFKLFTRSAAQKVFPHLHISTWAFDVELLMLANKLQIPVLEVGVNWKEIADSKYIPFWSWLEMAKGIFLIWFMYTVRLWKIQ